MSTPNDRFGVYDHTEGAWVFICETFNEAEQALWAHDSKDCTVEPCPDGTASTVEKIPDGEPQFGSPSPQSVLVTPGIVPISG